MKLLDREEFESLFNTCYAPVLRYCMTMVGDIGQAEDIVQQAYMNLWLKKDKLDSSQLRAYLYKTVYHASLDHAKHQQVRKRYERSWNASFTVVSPSSPGTASELETAIRTAIEALPEQCRKIFRMSRVEQLKYREIASTLELSEKTVENQMGKALKILRVSLREYLPLLFLIALNCK